MTNTTSVFTYLPDNLDIAQHVPHKWQDYAAWFVGGLYVRKHTEKYANPNDFRRVNSGILKQILPKSDYKRIINTLVEKGIVEQDGSYWAGVKGMPGWSKGYRLAPKYRNASYRRVQLRHHELVRKVDAWRRKSDRELLPVHLHLKANLHRLEILPAAGNDLPVERLRDEGGAIFEVCPYGRVHTNLTNLASKHRKHLRIGGRPLWGIDIVNSQPLLLGLTFMGQGEMLGRELAAYQAWLVKRRANHQDVVEVSGPDWSLSNHPKAFPSPSLNPSSYVGISSNGHPSDVAEYMRLCLEGGIYERLMELTGFDRSMVKKEFFRAVYGRPQDSQDSFLGRAFISAFPDCWAKACMLKAGCYKDLARRMQLVESYLVITKTCGRLMTEYPTAPLLTIHDSLVTDESHAEVFSEILVAEFQKTFGVAPKVKSKAFCESASVETSLSC